ncbi:MAG: hypothetical protein ACKO23_12350, partial [Gemmataceae bacterium]
MNHYSHLNLIDLKQAVDALPRMAKIEPKSGALKAEATGTDPGFGCTIVARTGGKTGQDGVMVGNEALAKGSKHASPQLVKKSILSNASQDKSGITEGGTRTHTPVRTPDFESDASA